MLTLGLDTSTEEGSVALGRADTILGERVLSVRATHSETVLPAIDELLTESGVRARELDAVVVGAGPGSFTGVRIAAALARGLCFQSEVELLAYSSLTAIAAECLGTSPDKGVCALLDARRDQVYSAGFQAGASPRAVFEPRASSIGDLLEDLALDDWTFCGVLSAAQREQLSAAGARLASDHNVYPRASALVRLSWADPAAGKIDDPAHWEPEYVRSSSAERRVTRD